MPEAVGLTEQVEVELGKRYFQIIPASNPNASAGDQRKNQLSRALAAFSIEKLAGVTVAQAAHAVVDGGDDNGIDAIGYDRDQHRLWLVQSKAGGAPDLGETGKFVTGVGELVAGRFANFNDEFRRVQKDVEDALSTDGVIIEGCVVHLGDQLAVHATNALEALATDLNRFGERFVPHDYGVHAVHGWLTTEHQVQPPDVTVRLRCWYGVTEPHRAFYGLVSAGDLAALHHEHGNSLFQRNIRHYLGTQVVNDAIQATVEDRPGDLFYLNNGLTAIGTSITPNTGATQETGSFACRGFSVVNGAQTIGAIAALQEAGAKLPADAAVLLTLIEVADGAALGDEITRARNTQNAVRGLDFAALDPNQERLRRELAVSGVGYVYRPTAAPPSPEPNRVTIEEAALALAALQCNTATVVAAKRAIGQIHDPTGPHYSRLFRSELTGIQLCRRVRVFRNLDSVFTSSENAETQGRRRAFYRHGRLFILHILARRHQELLNEPEITVSAADQAALSRIATELAEIVYSVAEGLFVGQNKGYLAMFRNLTDSTGLAVAVMQRLAQEDAQQAAAAAAGHAPPAATEMQEPPLTDES
ncbi:MAG: AIPR family protein [Armatimonadetes bacterium]|nr:AIPR family protein [Armatimonadota bacterium]